MRSCHYTIASRQVHDRAFDRLQKEKKGEKGVRGEKGRKGAEQGVRTRKDILSLRVLTPLFSDTG